MSKQEKAKKDKGPMRKLFVVFCLLFLFCLLFVFCCLLLVNVQNLENHSPEIEAEFWRDWHKQKLEKSKTEDAYTIIKDNNIEKENLNE